jgi:hypothetical protein
MRFEKLVTDANETCLIELVLNSEPTPEQVGALQDVIQSLLPKGWVRCMAAPKNIVIIAASTGVDSFVARRLGTMTPDDLPMVVLRGLAKSGLVRFYGNRETGEYDAWAWPGGYPIGYVTDCGDMVCADCLNGDEDAFASSIDEDQRHTGFYIEGLDVLDGQSEDYDGSHHCAQCNKDFLA